MTDVERLAVESLLADSRTPQWVRDAVTASALAIELESHTFDASYLAFLAEQIELEPRGPHWTPLLQARLDAFNAVVGKPLLRVGVAHGARRFVGHVSMGDLTVVHAEQP